MAALTVLEHPLAGALLTRLRDRATGPAEYRALTRRLGLLLVAEATRDLAVETDTVETPLETYDGSRLVRGLVAIPVLRAGLGLLEAVVDLYPDAVVGYLGHGARRDHALAARLLREAAAHGRTGAHWWWTRCSPPAGPAARPSRT